MGKEIHKKKKWKKKRERKKELITNGSRRTSDIDKKRKMESSDKGEI
jgi:hypothetical protein